MTFARFQYPKVRLKGNPFLKIWSLKTISIPEGAIKRILRKQIHMKPFHISIPEGAIKRAQTLGQTRAKVKFQYPKVRLKVVITKSHFEKVDLFQYPKVRLKVAAVAVDDWSHFYFNTRRCD